MTSHQVIDRDLNRMIQSVASPSAAIAAPLRSTAPILPPLLPPLNTYLQLIAEDEMSTTTPTVAVTASATEDEAAVPFASSQSSLLSQVNPLQSDPLPSILEEEKGEPTSSVTAPSKAQRKKGQHILLSAKDKLTIWTFGETRDCASAVGQTQLTWRECASLLTQQVSAETCRSKYMSMKAKVKRTHQRDASSTRRRTPTAAAATAASPASFALLRSIPSLHLQQEDFDQAHPLFSFLHSTHSEDEGGETKISQETEEKKFLEQEEKQEDEEMDNEVVDMTQKATAPPVPSRRSLPTSAAEEWCHESIEALLEYRRLANSDPDPLSLKGWDKVVMPLHSQFPAFEKWHEMTFKKECRIIYQHLYNTNQLGSLSPTNESDASGHVEMSPHDDDEWKGEEEEEEEGKIAGDINEEQPDISSLGGGRLFCPVVLPEERKSESIPRTAIAARSSTPPRQSHMTQEEHKSDSHGHATSTPTARGPAAPILCDSTHPHSTGAPAVPTISASVPLASPVAPTVSAAPVSASLTALNLNVGSAMMMSDVDSSSLSNLLNSINWSQVDRTIALANFIRQGCVELSKVHHLQR